MLSVHPFLVLPSSPFTQAPALPFAFITNLHHLLISRVLFPLTTRR